MQDIFSTLNSLRRPHLLIRAARIGVQDYRRTTHLRPFFGIGSLPRSGAALMHLIELEATIDRERLARSIGYSAERHVELLIAMMGEARVLRNAHLTPVT